MNGGIFEPGDELLRLLEVRDEPVLVALAEEVLEYGPAPAAFAVELVTLPAVLAVDRRAADADRLRQRGEAHAVSRNRLDVREERRHVLVGVFAVLLRAGRLRAPFLHVRDECISRENVRPRREADRVRRGVRRRPAIRPVARRAAAPLVGREAAEKARVRRLRGAAKARGRLDLRRVERAEDEEREEARADETPEDEDGPAVPGPARGAAVEPRHEREEEHRETGKNRRADRLERALEELQELKERQEVPLGSGHGRRVRRIGEPLERRGMPRGEPEEREDDGENHDAVARRLEREERLSRVGVRRRSRVTVPAQEKEMDGDEGECEDREQHDVERVEARQRRGADGGPAGHEARRRPTHDGKRRRHLRPDDRRPVRLLVPREEIAREAESEDEEEERDAHEPVQLAGAAVRAEDERARHVEDGEDDHRRGAPVVEASHEPAREEPRLDRLHAFPRVVRRRRVREREREAGDELDEKDDERRGSQREEPRAPDGDGLVGERPPERARATPRLEKIENSLHASSAAASSCRRPPATTSGRRVERPRRRTGQHVAARPVDAAVAGAQERFPRRVPRHAAAEMAARRVESRETRRGLRVRDDRETLLHAARHVAVLDGALDDDLFRP